VPQLAIRVSSQALVAQGQGRFRMVQETLEMQGMGVAAAALKPILVKTVPVVAVATAFFT
tara:strand:- start:273 stop:452 length:180 start_codon:yes stop_codon:yes gene_type:complete